MPTPITTQRLYRAVVSAWNDQRVYRQLRLEAAVEYRGRFHDRADDQKRHLNLVSKAIGSYIRQMTGSAPENDVEYDNLALRPDATMLQLYLDRLGEKMERRKLARLCLLDAFLGNRAVVRCGLKSGSDRFKIQGRLYDAGQFYWKRILNEDHVYDPSARQQEELGWEGNFYRVPRPILQECGLFNPDVIERLPGLDDGTWRDAERSENQRSRDADRYELTDLVELLDIALYDAAGNTIIVTMPALDHWDEDFLRIEEYEGPRRGPYEWLEFDPQPDTIEAKPPIADLREAAEAMYVISTKWIEQIERTKRILAANRDISEDDLDVVRTAEDGDTVHVDDVSKMAMQEFGGASNEFPAAMQVLQTWSNIASNNSDILSGQGADTDKVGIYQGLQANASMTLDDYIQTHEDFEARLSEHAAFHATNNPFMRMPMIFQMPGGERIQVAYTPDQKRADWFNFRYKIRSYSMVRHDRATKLAGMFKMLEGILAAAETSMATGGMIDVAGVARVAGRALGLREMQEIVHDEILMLESQMAAPAQQQPGKGTPTGQAGNDAGYQFRFGQPRIDQGTSAGQGFRGALPRGPARLSA